MCLISLSFGRYNTNSVVGVHDSSHNQHPIFEHFYVVDSNGRFFFSPSGSDLGDAGIVMQWGKPPFVTLICCITLVAVPLAQLRTAFLPVYLGGLQKMTHVPGP